MKTCNVCKATKPLDEFYKTYAKCKECTREYNREYNKKNRDRLRKKSQQWNRDNREHLGEYKRNRDQKRVKGLTEEQLEQSRRWIEAIKNLRFCTYCGTRDAEAYEVEHDIPVSRGGNDHWTNLVIACRDCNRSKYNRTGAEWMEILRKREIRDFIQRYMDK